MSKLSFSRNVLDVMKKKNDAIREIDYENFLQRDEYFELALCIAYTTLSKEKIILKESKNEDPLGRLTEVVDTKEIDKVFDPSFNPEMPVINQAYENNNVWILDAIRDSIIHGKFDVDEERKVFLLNNNQDKRTLVAEIPFSWFIAYAKNDITTKRIADKYAYQGFFYNIRKADRNQLNTKRELEESIFYNIYVTGTSFNIKEVERDIQMMLFQYAHSNCEINLEGATPFEKGRYEKYYLSTFLFAKKQLKEYLEKKYPGMSVDIVINSRKARLINKLTKRLPKTYSNYNLMIDTFNQEVALKGISLLENISDIIENLHDNYCPDTKHYCTIDDLKKFNDLINSNCEYYNDKQDINTLYNRTYNLLRSLFINVVGLNTLVINYEDLIETDFIDEDPLDYRMYGYSNSLYSNYAQERKKLNIQILDKEVSLVQERKNLAACPEDKKPGRESAIAKLLVEKSTLENELAELPATMNYSPIVKDYDNNLKNVRGLQLIENDIVDKLLKTDDKKEKAKYKKIVKRLEDLIIKEEGKCTYGKCYNMKDILTIVRNSLAHIGRTNAVLTNNIENKIYLNDYDTKDNTRSGVVVIGYDSFLDLMESICNREELTLTRTK